MTSSDASIKPTAGINEKLTRKERK